MSQVREPSTAERALDALGRHAWREAYELMVEADHAGQLSPEELMLLAQAAWWVGKLPSSIEALERAYAGALNHDRPDQAAMAAILLGRDNVLRNHHSVATAWLKRAEHLIEGQPESPLTGWLAATRAFQAGLAGPIEATLRNADIAEDIAMRFGDRNLAALAMSCRGMGLVGSGQPAEGLAILDEAAVAAAGGALDPSTAGGVYCAVIGACTTLGEWTRAAQWTDAQDRWCEREGINGYPGTCRLYRAEIKSLRGLWLEAEAEARRASEELKGYIPAAAGLALYQIGELRLRRGDLPAAEEALLEAHAIGNAEPAMSLVRLAQGKTAAALDSIRRALDGSNAAPSWGTTPNSLLSRATMLPAQVEIAIAAGDLPTATAASDELTALAAQFGTAAIHAHAAAAQGAVLLAGGEARAAIDSLRRAVKGWREIDAPWEAARSRLLLAEALLADGGAEAAALELRAARSVLEELGALPDVRRADALLARAGDAGAGGASASASPRVLRTFVFTDIVESTRLAEASGDEAWDRALRWHDRTIRGRLSEHGGEEVKRTGDGFFVAFDDPDRAIEFAIAVQRGLADRPADLAVEVLVRIGIHRAEANRSGLDYVGSGVNVAARIAGAAQAAEILVSHATLDVTRRRYDDTGRRDIALRGVSAPVEVVAVAWH